MICYIVYEVDKLFLYNTFSALFVCVFFLYRDKLRFVVSICYIYIHLVETSLPPSLTLPVPLSPLSHTCSLHCPN